MKFETAILQQGNNTGIVVPPEVVEALGAGKKPKVVVALKGHTYRSSIASMGGQFLISLSAENRAKSGAVGGEAVEVELEVDTAPREVEVPPDLAVALAADKTAGAIWETYSYSNKLRHVLSVTGAKTEETRAKRVAKVIEAVHAGK